MSMAADSTPTLRHRGHDGHPSDRLPSVGAASWDAKFTADQRRTWYHLPSVRTASWAAMVTSYGRLLDIISHLSGEDLVSPPSSV